MALNSEVQSLVVEKKVRTNDFAVKSNVALDADKLVDKILFCSSSVAIKNVEPKDKVIEFSGNVYYDFVYVAKNGEVERANCVVEFSSKCDGSLKKPIVTAKVLDTKLSISNSGELIEMESAITYEVFNFFTEQINMPESSQNLFVKSNNMSIKNIVDRNCELFTILDDEQLSERIKSIVNINSTIIAKNIDVKSDIIAVEFDIIKDITYLFGEDNLTKLERKTHTFKQEFANRFGDLSQVIIDLQIKSVKANMEYESDKNNTNMTMVYIISADIKKIKTQNLNVIEDAFSEKVEIFASKECFLVEEVLENKTFDEKLSVMVEIKKDIQEILCVGNVETILSSQKYINDYLQIEGVILGDILYKDFNSNSIMSQKISAPFQVNFLNPVGNVKDVNCLPQMRVIGQKHKGSNGIELILDSYFDTTFYGETNVCFISSVQEGDVKSDNNAPISVYICDENEDDYSIAKGLNVNPDCLNAELQTKDKGFISVFREIN